MGLFSTHHQQAPPPDANMMADGNMADAKMAAGGNNQSNMAVLANPTKLRLPPSFHLFYNKGLHWKFYLGEEKGNPLYAVDMPMNEWGDVILCDGPSESSPQIAISKRDNYLKGLVKFWLPPMGHGTDTICEELRLRGQMITEKYTFAILCGEPGPSAMPEKFEWKPAGMSKLPGMGSLAMTYECIRLGRGNEVVAKFTNGTSGGLRSKLASIQFLGSGATGELGDLWTLMATMSFLRIWQRYFQSYSVLNNVTAAGA